MKRISIESSFGWAQAVVAREWRLIVPVMLAFLVLPPFAIDVLLPDDIAKVMATRPIDNLQALQAALAWVVPLMLVLLLTGAVGMLTISALALTPRMSVAEAIGRALRRLPVLVVAMAGMLAGLVIVATMLALIAQLSGMDTGRVQLLLMACLTVALMLGAVRLALLGPVVIDRPVGPVTALVMSWRLAGGVFWRILAGLLVYAIGASVALLASLTALSTLILLGAKAGGVPALAPPLIALVTRFGAGCAVTGSYLLIAGFYRQLAGASKAI